MIKRDVYLNKMVSWREKQLIKVVTGVHRCGKSTLFLMYIAYLKQLGVNDDQIIFINLEDIDNEALLDYKALYEFIKLKLCIDKFTYIFIDEVQNCKEFEKAVDSLFIKKMLIYITGSNAFMLSSELATLLSGRYVELEVLPLSFSEYMLFTNASQTDLKSTFNDYLKFSSFPYIASLSKEKAVITSYIEGIYNSILIKDIAIREGINDISVLESVVKVLASSIGSPISCKKISDTINSNGRKILVNTVDNYVKALTESYIFYKVNRYDIKGRQFLKTLGKYYIVDTGIRALLVSGSSSDLERLLENVVYFELLRRYDKVSIGKLSEKEIDFIAEDINGIAYFQVSASLLDESTLKRELAPLQKTGNFYSKYLLTLDDIMPNEDFDGIKLVNVIKWLLQGN